MASVILLVKQTEDDEKVIYRFGPNERKMGLIEMNKIKESVKELEPVQVDGVSPSFSLTEPRSDWYDVYSGKAASSRNERRLNHSPMAGCMTSRLSRQLRVHGLNNGRSPRDQRWWLLDFFCVCCTFKYGRQGPRRD